MNTLRKLILFAIVGILPVSPAFALFTNGGFESGDLTGWTVEYTTVDEGQVLGTWGAYVSGPVAGVMDSTFTYTEVGAPPNTKDIDPYYGNYSAAINDLSGYWHATKISQTDTISQAEIDAGATLYVEWGALLVEPLNTAHAAGGDAPFFNIGIKVNGSIVDSFYADAELKQGGGWEQIGKIDSGTSPYDDIWYKTGIYSYDLTGYSAGDSVTVEMWVADCGLGAHGGMALLDGIGLDRPEIPVPGAFLLGGIGVGIVGLMKRRRTL